MTYVRVNGTVVDAQGSPLSELVAVIIPAQQTPIEPNEVIKTRLFLEGIGPEAVQAIVRMDVASVIFDCSGLGTVPVEKGGTQIPLPNRKRKYNREGGDL
jgi:hypothetical protein